MATEGQADREDGNGNENGSTGTPVSLNENSTPGAEMKVYPNPTTGALVVELLNIEGNPEIMLLDASGKLLQRDWIQTSAGKAVRYDLDLSSYPEGMYLIKLQSESNISTQRVILQ